MPESALLVLCFGYAYFAFRALTVRGFRAALRSNLRSFILVNALGFGLAAFFLTPFLELINEQFVRCTSTSKLRRDIMGLRHDRFGLSIFTYIVPALFGPTWAPIAPSAAAGSRPDPSKISIPRLPCDDSALTYLLTSSRIQNPIPCASDSEAARQAYPRPNMARAHRLF